MKRILLAACTFSFLSVPVFSNEIPSSNKILKTIESHEDALCIIDDGIYHCELDVFDVNNNTVQTYYDVAIQVYNCEVVDIFHDEFMNVEFETLRKVTDDLDAQSGIGDDFIYNYYNIREFLDDISE